MIATSKQQTGLRAFINAGVIGICVMLITSVFGSGSIASGQTPKRFSRNPPQTRTVWSSKVVDADASSVPSRPTSRTSSRPPQPASRPTQASQPSLVRVTPRAISTRDSKQASGSEIQQVGYLEDYGRCGPVCDCGHCGSATLVDPGCGIEVGYAGEVACGVEPGCGIEFGHGEVACGMEAVCGVEAYGISSDMCGCDACCGPAACGEVGCDTYGCDAPCNVDCFPLFLPILRVDWNRFEFFYGTQAYHNPMNDPATGTTTRTDSGSFGFHQGFNEGRNLRPWFGTDLSAQFGLRATQSNIHDENFTNDMRNQIFVTGGLFRRVDYGLQYGIVLDYLNEDWYYQADLLQLRGEVSWKMSACHNFGFHWMAGVNDDDVPTIVTNEAGTRFSGRETLEASNQYRAFYRYLFSSTGEWTSYLGGTDDDHFIIGSQIDIPLKHCFSLQVGTTYFSPDDESSRDEDVSEGWNLSMSMVYRPGQHHPSMRYRRPMFNVADNGSFFVFR